MNTMHRRFITALLTFTCLALSRTSAVVIGQIDTFENGTTQGWSVGTLGAPHPAPPTNVLGGLAGATDNYLRLTSLGGSGPGSRLSVTNDSQWTGNYTSAGIGFISMDLINLGSSDLALRLAFEDPVGGPPTNIAFSKNAFLLPAGGGWTHATFSLGLSDLQAGIGNIGSALMNTTTIRLYHSDTANFPNPILPLTPIVAQLGVDNIQANSNTSSRVPETGATAAMLLPLFFAAAWLKRRARTA